MPGPTSRALATKTVAKQPWSMPSRLTTIRAKALVSTQAKVFLESFALVRATIAFVVGHWRAYI